MIFKVEKLISDKQGRFVILKLSLDDKAIALFNIYAPIGGGHWGLRYCGIGQFFMRYFGNFNLELRYCGIFQTCGMRFLYVLVDDIRYKNVSFTFFRPFIAVFGRFGSTLKRPYFVTHFNLQFDCFNNPFKAVPLFPRSHRSFLPLFLLSR